MCGDESPSPQHRAGDDVDDLTTGLVNSEPLDHVRRQPIPSPEQTRRAVLFGLTVSFAAVLLLQIGFALLGGDLWERVGPVLSTAATLIAAGWGYGGPYFSGKG